MLGEHREQRRGLAAQRALDKAHPTSGDCNGCHTTTPTFAGNVTQSGKPANHIPTTAACTQCHTTAGNYASIRSRAPTRA